MSTDDVVEQMGDDDSVSVIKKGEGSNVPPPQVGGWAANMTTKGRNSLFSTEEEDVRLHQNDSNDADLPVIPDIEEILEDDLTTQMAVPPSVSVTRVATYNQLNTDLSRHAGLFTMDGDIDLKLLASALIPEADVEEVDKCWEWDKLFAELSPDIQAMWDDIPVKGDSEKTAASASTSEGVLSLPDT